MGQCAVEAQTIIWTHLGAPMVDSPILISHHFQMLAFPSTGRGCACLEDYCSFHSTMRCPSNKSTPARVVDLRLLFVPSSRRS